MKPLHAYAAEIRKDWKKPYFGAVPYIDALGALNTMADNYGLDPAPGIVAYFLANARGWKGPVAKAVKADLNALLKASYKR